MKDTSVGSSVSVRNPDIVLCEDDLYPFPYPGGLFSREVLKERRY
jgi:hypothetical protein